MGVEPGEGLGRPLRPAGRVAHGTARGVGHERQIRRRRDRRASPSRENSPQSRSADPLTRPASHTSARTASKQREPRRPCRTPSPQSRRSSANVVATVFALRISARTSAATPYTAGSMSTPRGLADRLRCRPRAAVHRALPPPRPHLFGDERQVRREQSQQACRGRAPARSVPTRHRVVAGAVGALLHQLDVVVAEAPEEPLGPFQRTRVVVAVECGGHFRD